MPTHSQAQKQDSRHAGTTKAAGGAVRAGGRSLSTNANLRLRWRTSVDRMRHVTELNSTLCRRNKGHRVTLTRAFGRDIFKAKLEGDFSFFC